MKKKFYSLIFLFLIFFSAVSAQTDSVFRFIKKIDFPVSDFSVDNIGEVYLITPENQLKKYNEKGDSAGVFNEVRKYGKLTYVNCENPWKTILYYQNFSTILLLDKYLNVVSSINLRRQNIFRVQAVATSYDNNIWLFDEQDNKLKKINDNGDIMMESVDFRMLFDSVPDPKQIIDRDQFVYLYDPQKGVYIFDHYGTFKNKLTFLHWKDIDVIGKDIYGFDDENLYKYSPPVPDFSTYQLPVQLRNSSSLKIRNEKVYVLKDNRLSIYSLH